MAWGTGSQAGDSVIRRLSPITLRILAVNSLALVILAVGLLYLDRYQEGLVRAEIEAIKTQANLIAGALGEGATVVDEDGEARLDINNARILVRRLSGQSLGRAQLFDENGGPLLDSLSVVRPGGVVTVLPLPDESEPGRLMAAIDRIYDWIFYALPRRDNFPPYIRAPLLHANDYPEGAIALLGEPAAGAYLEKDGHLVFTVAVPVQRYRQVIGVLMLSRPSNEMDDALRRVRFDIIMVFGAALLVTALMSIYLASSIARPLRRLAIAAERVRQGRSRGGIPDFAERGDEIGDLSVALRSMTAALQDRMSAIERFAADVAHELKNPLTSLRSAVETAARVEKPEQRARLTQIILEDVGRLDRLISDIASASRVDAEMARVEPQPVDLGRLLAALAEVHEATSDEPDLEGGIHIAVDIAPDFSPVVMGLEDRLVQVFRNLLANALSFSPPGTTIRIVVERQERHVRVAVEDEGPGIPPGKADAIFDRFYTERPQAEKFGLHSGLGLSISRQIVEAHGGTIRAENRTDRSGARFIVLLPLGVK